MSFPSIRGNRMDELSPEIGAFEPEIRPPSSANASTPSRGSSGYKVRLPAFQLSSPLSVSVQTAPSPETKSLRIALLGRLAILPGCQGSLRTPSKRYEPESVPV